MKDAQGHGSNSRGYRGKYPNKINQVSSITGQRGVMRVQTNAGDRFDIHGRDTGGVMPKSGQDIGDHPYAARVGGPNNSDAASQLASGAKSSPAPIHDSMGGNNGNTTSVVRGEGESDQSYSGRRIKEMIERGDIDPNDRRVRGRY